MKKGLKETLYVTKLLKAVTIIEGRMVTTPDGTVAFEKPNDWDFLGFQVAPSTQFWKKFCEALGQDPEVPLKWMGKGQKGVAYQLSNGNVAKITTDVREAATALYLKEKQQASEEMRFLFYRIYKVFPIKIGGLMRFVLVTEPLSKFEGTDKESWLKFADEWNKFIRIKRGTLDDKITQKIRPDAVNKIPELKRTDKTPNILPHNVEEFLGWLHARGIPATAEETKWLQDVAKLLAGGSKKERIEFADLHGGNIMWRESTQSPVLIDLGGSNSPPASQKMPPAIGKLLAASIILEFSYKETLNHSGLNPADV